MEQSPSLVLEIEELERRGKPGCGTSSSTNPRCTCFPLVIEDDD